MSAATMNAKRTLPRASSRRVSEVAEPAKTVTVFGFDRGLLLAAITLFLLGLVLVATTSVAEADFRNGDALYYFKRQLLFVGLAVVVAGLIAQVPLSLWAGLRYPLMAAAFLLLLLVFVPGLGKTVNGSTRWLNLGVFTMQASEAARLCLVMYFAGYLVKHSQQVTNTVRGILIPGVVLMGAGVLLLRQPDFGSFVMLVATGLAMLFIGGVRWRWIALVAVIVIAGSLLLIQYETYRLARLKTFLDPWADPFGTGYQTVQALIAIGRGGWDGVGLGNSVQKLFYLPEAHTDFVFAVYAEEFGLFGVIALFALFGFFVWRAFAIAIEAAHQHRWYNAYLCFGLATWLAMQALVHVAVNMSWLPAKGLTLPFLSYGGSSLLVTGAIVGLLLRASQENIVIEARSGKKTAPEVAA